MNKLMDNVLFNVILSASIYIGAVVLVIAYQPIPPSTVQLELPPQEISPNRNWGVEWDQEDLYCLALNIYFEARGEPVEGKYAVGDVVMYRAMHADYPDTICGVIKDGYYYSWNPEVPVRHMCQFSWWCDGKHDNPADGQAFEEALLIAEDILTNPTYPGIIDHALFYHAEYVQPQWAARLEHVSTIGEHRFYRP